MRPLGRVQPPDWVHVDRFPLIGLPPADRPRNVPVAIGVNWYTNFDNPAGGWIGRGDLGTIRGGHCVCLEPRAPVDASSWWGFYDQGAEGACEGFGHSRMMSLLNRKRYDGSWLYREGQKIDGIPGPHDGTTNRAVLEVLRTEGHRAVVKGRDLPVAIGEGVSAYRWATSAQDVLTALGTPGRDYVTVLNSWGRSYPHRVRLPAEVLDRLLREDGEAGVVTDR